MVNSEHKKKNRLLQICHASIPYIKEIKTLPLVKSTNACILMQQLEYWMAIKPKGFYKFQAPPETTQFAYRIGDSWTEELGISENEFRTAFKQIGVGYKSKKLYDAARVNGDEFDGKYYCCYFDKVSRLTHYFRNTSLVETAIDQVAVVIEGRRKGEHSNLANPTNSVPRDGESAPLGNGNVAPESTENTSDNTHNITTIESETLSSSSIHNQEFVSSESNYVREELSSPDVTEILKQCDSTRVSERNFVPTDFTPSLDERRRAVESYPDKSPSYVTKKFVEHYLAKGLRLTMSEWHNKWWDWMNTEIPSYGNSEIEREHVAIKNEALEELGEIIRTRLGYAFTLEDLASLASDVFTPECTQIVANDMIYLGDLGLVSNYLYERSSYEADADFQADVDDAFYNLGLPPPSEKNSQ